MQPQRAASLTVTSVVSVAAGVSAVCVTRDSRVTTPGGLFAYALASYVGRERADGKGKAG